MKGFKDSTRTRSGFSFPSSAGFTSSTGKTQNISYIRKTPHRGKSKFADGGEVKKIPRNPNPPKKGFIESIKDYLSPKNDEPTQAGADRQRTIDRTVDSMDHKRGGRIRKAEGGRVNDSALTRRSEPTTALDAESGGKTPLRPGYTRGGYASKYAKGGKPFAKKC